MLMARFSQETRCSSYKIQPLLVSHIHLCLCAISMDVLNLEVEKLFFHYFVYLFFMNLLLYCHVLIST